MLDTREILPCVGCSGNLTPQAVQESFALYGAIRIARAIAPPLVTRFAREAQKLFALPENVKVKCRRIGNGSGYTPLSVEGVIGHGPDPMRHFWDITEDCEIVKKEAPAFCQAAMDLWLCLTDHVARVCAQLDAAYGSTLSLDTLCGAHSLRTSQYCNATASAATILFPSHLDFSIFTFYLGGTSKGLEVEIAGGWRELYNPAGSVVVGAGTTLRLYAPDLVKPLRHRVMGSTAGRISAVFFAEPRRDVVLPNGLAWQAHHDRLMKQVRHE